jgi:hypothetical protein
MNFLQRIASFFSGGGGGPSSRYMTVYVLSRRCNEPIAGQVDLLNELSQAEDEAYRYYTRKVFHTSGANRCFGQVEVTLHFDGNKRVVDHSVQGGEWLTYEEYEAALERFNTPPEDDESNDESDDGYTDHAEDEAADSSGAPSQPPTHKKD